MDAYCPHCVMPLEDVDHSTCTADLPEAWVIPVEMPHGFNSEELNEENVFNKVLLQGKKKF
jgi:hypothetical protein